MPIFHASLLAALHHSMENRYPSLLSFVLLLFFFCLHLLWVCEIFCAMPDELCPNAVFCSYFRILRLAIQTNRNHHRRHIFCIFYGTVGRLCRLRSRRSTDHIYCEKLTVSVFGISIISQERNRKPRLTLSLSLSCFLSTVPRHPIEYFESNKLCPLDKHNWWHLDIADHCEIESQPHISIKYYVTQNTQIGISGLFYSAHIQ